jgi:virulence-associated protein VapD
VVAVRKAEQPAFTDRNRTLLKINDEKNGLCDIERTMSTGSAAVKTVEIRLDSFPVGVRRMYAIAFDLDTAQLQAEYPNASWQNAYGDIKKVLLPLGFNWQQGSVYFGGKDMDAVKCVLAAQALSNAYPWFKNCVRDLRMLRIEELNDLSPAL